MYLLSTGSELIKKHYELLWIHLLNSRCSPRALWTSSYCHFQSYEDKHLLKWSHIVGWLSCGLEIRWSSNQSIALGPHQEAESLLVLPRDLEDESVQHRQHGHPEVPVPVCPFGVKSRVVLGHRLNHLYCFLKCLLTISIIINKKSKISVV